ncbi:MAG: hypothetical protein M3495_14515 [Pseudomonadota bacterium]|nr:hypothetical protein [Pseudomonadota bacterium]
MPVYLGRERLVVLEEAIEHLPGILERFAEGQYLLELRAGIGHREGIDVLEEDEDLRCAGLLPAVQRPVELFLGVGAKAFGVGRLLAPAAVQGEDEDVRAVDVLVDHALGAAAGRGQRVLPAERHEPHPGAVTEAAVQLVDHVLERAPLDRQIARRSDEDVDQSGLRAR